MHPSKCYDELLEKHTFLVLKYSYSDEVFLLTARRIPIRRAFHKNNLLKSPGKYLTMGSYIRKAPRQIKSLVLAICRSGGKSISDIPLF